MVNWWEISLELAGGLALFLYGMVQMTDALKSVAGKKLTTFLEKMTRNRWTAMTAGAGITTVIQSSSVTTVLMVGFVSAGLMNFSKTIGIILGANIGTTVTAQIIAFKITDAALLIIAAGYLVTAITKKRQIRDYGNVLLGLGLIFLGMNLMTKATMPLKDYEPFLQIMQEIALPVYGIIIGAVFTAIVQSSSATTGVVIVLASQNLLNIETGIAVIIGANIGTCVTALLASIGKPRSAIQVAIAHILLKTAGAIIFIFFIPRLSFIVTQISAQDIGRQIANAHTIFNVGSALLFIGFTPAIARLIKKLYPDKTPTDRSISLLDQYYLENTNLALDMVEKSLKEMGEDLLQIAKKSLPTAVQGDEVQLDELRCMDEAINSWHRKILAYIGQIQQQELTDQEMERIRKQTDIANLLENAGDMYTSAIFNAARHRLEIGFGVSDETHRKLLELFKYANKSVELALNAYHQHNTEKAIEVTSSKKQFSIMHAEVHKHVYARLSNREKNRVAIIRFEIELLEIARRLHSLARRIARRTDKKIKKKRKGIRQG